MSLHASSRINLPRPALAEHSQLVVGSLVAVRNEQNAECRPAVVAFAVDAVAAEFESDSDTTTVC
ncbi:hypothetical protein DPMN_111457 [Dreissena polymorpha]|uniref:Uncharacterized protein n=1 Tax=Dreissena polymorpha TaxID=45954 RepID=A0A9D4QNU5_DREPO|nr:hypothetical protein DPMN_111457 [Dreissena polymorpha]